MSSRRQGRTLLVIGLALAGSVAAAPGIDGRQTVEREATGGLAAELQELGRQTGDRVWLSYTVPMPELEVKEQAVFALSQLPDGEGVTRLIELATTHAQPEVRRAALFWLGQSGDPRALDLFERVLE